MVSAKRAAEQKRFQKRRERAKLAKQPRKWKAYLRKERDRRRRARANFHIQVEAKLKEAKEKGVQAYTERLAKIQDAQCDACKKRFATPPTGCRIWVWSCGARMEGVVGKDNRIETPNIFLQQVSEEGVASSGTEEPEETRFEDRLCSLQEEWCDSIRSRSLHLSRMPALFRKQKVQRRHAKELQVPWLQALGMHSLRGA